jgi:dUTP pyrophosphatase
MKVKIKLIDKSLPLPQYQTSGAVAFDLYARQDLIILPNEVARIPTNLIIAVPAGHMLYLRDRSSTAKKKGLMVTAGVIDQDFHGPEDELLFQVYNFTKQQVVIKKGERIGQGVFVKIDQAEWEEVIGENIKSASRGGFGSTD